MTSSPIGKFILSNAMPMVATAFVATAGPKCWNYVSQSNLLQGLSTSENTGNWTEQARNGKLRRAHGRESILQNLHTAVANHSIVMLVGPSGSGKTALVEELTCRLLNEREDSKLYGAEVLSLDQRKMEGEPGLRGAVTNLMDGGPQKRVQQIMEYLSRLNDDGKVKILFIDEFQDLLRNNFKVFNQFKTELARTGIRIIGTTTDKDLIQDWLSQGEDGVGLERRVEIIEVPEMRKKETRAVLEKDFARISREHEKTKFVFSTELAHVIVELSHLLKPKVVLPDRAISLLNDVCESCAATADSTTVTIGRKEVEAYIASRRALSVHFVHESLEAIERRKKFLKTFDETYFPRMQKLPVHESVACLTSSIQGEAERVGLFFAHHDFNGRLTLQGSSQSFLNDIVSHWSCKADYEIYRCDVDKLVKEANTYEGRIRLIKTFKEVFKQNKKALLVLENCSPEWLGTLPQPESRPVQHRHEGISKGGIMKALQPLQKTLDAAGLGPYVEDFLGKEEPPPCVEPAFFPQMISIPAIVVELFEHIERVKLSSITLLGQESQVRLKKERNAIAVQPLNLQQILTWLNERFELRLRKQADTEENIQKMVLALYCLKDASVTLSVLELAAQAVDNLALGKTPADAILTVFKGSKSRSDVEEALAEGEKFLEEQPFSVVRIQPPAVEDAQLEETLYHFLASPKSGILCIVEKTKARQQCYIGQIASRLGERKTCVWFDHRQAMSKIPLGIKSFVVQKYLENLQKADILMTDEEGLKHETFKEIISALDEPKKIIVFKNPSHAAGEKTADNLVNKIVEAGARLITDKPPAPETQSMTIADPFFRDFEKSEFVSSELSAEELGQLLHKQLENPEMKDNLKSVIVSLYLLLIKQGQSIDYVLERLNHEVGQLEACDTTTVFDKFTQIHGKAMKMTLTDVKYEIDPSLTSWRYRLVRMVKGVASKTVTIGTLAFKYVITPFTAVSIVSTGGSWLVSRFLWRRS